MNNNKDHAGVYLPPPLIYIAIFLLAILIQNLVPLNKDFFYSSGATTIGLMLMLAGVVFNFPALRQFVKSKNTLVTVKPAHSLQTTGIYSVSRNPMYVSLLLFYAGLSFLIGNWWNLILSPLLVWVVQSYVIKREEKYLERRFGQAYLDYKSKVRRWI